MKSTVLVVALIGFAAAPALADRKAGDACAAGLTPDSKLIYANTIAAKVAPSQGRAFVVKQAEALIASGKMSTLEARATAEAAGRCLQLLPK